MCETCWAQEGRPQIDNAGVRGAAQAAVVLFSLCGDGGRLHTLVDDWNVDEEHIQFCEAELHEAGDYLDVDTAERACLAAFKVLSRDERLSALALADGYWG